MATGMHEVVRAPEPRRRALLFGHPGMLWHLPPVLHAAGFDVDVVTMPGIYLRVRRYVDRVTLRPDLISVVLAAARQAATCRYDWVVVTDDASLAVLGSDEFLPLADRLRLAPVVGPEYLSHLGSKVQLSQWLAASGVTTPDYRIATDLAAAEVLADEVGYPLVVKADRCSGGNGVRIVDDPASLAGAWREVFGEERHAPPALVQQFVRGQMYDLSTVFLKGHPVSITVAQILRTQGR